MAYMSPSPLELWRRFLEEMGHEVDPARLEGAHEEAVQFYTPRVVEYKGRLEELKLEFDALVLEELAIPDPKGEAARHVYDAFSRYESVKRLYPETKEALAALRRRGYELGVITDWTWEILDQLRVLDLEGYFGSVTHAQEVGAEKPDPSIFEAALRKAGCLPEEAAHVGNAYGQDVVGARGVGILPILLDREDAHPEADCLRAKSLSEVARLLEGAEVPRS